MANKNGGFIGTDGLDAPDPPTAVTPTGSNASLSIAFTAPTNTGTSDITGFVAQVSTDGTNYSAGSGTGSSSPITVSSLTNGTSYTAKVWAINAYGTSAPSDASSGVAPIAPTRGVFAFGGFNAMNTMEYFQINSGGEDASDFGDLSSNRTFYSFACSSSTRGIFGGGQDGSNNYKETMDYITIASTGNATDFGDFKTASTNTGNNGTASYQGAACSNSTRGIIARGVTKSGTNGVNDIDYITIANTGNSQDFGDLSQTVQYAGALSSTTRGIIFPGTGFDNAEYVTISSTGNATDFGAYNIAAGGGSSGASSNTRGLFIPGQRTTIRYCTIASTGGFLAFGDLTQICQAAGFTSDGITAVRCGGYNGSATVNIMDSFTIATLGDATDFGDLSATTYGGAACSDSHGGL